MRHGRRNPYPAWTAARPEAAADLRRKMVAGTIGAEALSLLKLVQSMACASGVGADPSGPGSRLLRMLDGAMNGLGEYTLIVRRASRRRSRAIGSTPPPGRFGASLDVPSRPVLEDGALGHLVE